MAQSGGSSGMNVRSGDDDAVVRKKKKSRKSFPINLVIQLHGFIEIDKKDANKPKVPGIEPFSGSFDYNVTQFTGYLTELAVSCLQFLLTFIISSSYTNFCWLPSFQ